MLKKDAFLDWKNPRISSLQIFSSGNVYLVYHLEETHLKIGLEEVYAPKERRKLLLKLKENKVKEIMQTIELISSFEVSEESFGSTMGYGKEYYFCNYQGKEFLFYKRDHSSYSPKENSKKKLFSLLNELHNKAL